MEAKCVSIPVVFAANSDSLPMLLLFALFLPCLPLLLRCSAYVWA